MTNLAGQKIQPLESKNDLMDYFAAGARPGAKFKIGTEHEKFLYRRGTHQRLPYLGPGGIGQVLAGYVEKFGWAPVYEQDNVIALKRGEASITLEPAGQFELSGAPLEDLHQTFEETRTHFDEMRALQQELDFCYLGLGVDPFTKREERPWMPKARYATMKEYMPSVGKLGLDMMTGTATIQVNLDFATEADMVRKFRAGLNLQPIATALFASSPFLHGKPNGYQSYRAHIWQDTDPDRCGWLPWAFDGAMGYEKYVDYLLDVPLYFALIEDGAGDLVPKPATGYTFGQFLKGALPFARGQKPSLKAWAYHAACVFPEVRLKQFLEMRGADAGPMPHITALSAFWVGLLYDDENLDFIEELTKGWTAGDRHLLYTKVPRMGLQTIFQRSPLLLLAKQLVQAAAQGLKRRNRKNAKGQDESMYLTPLTAYLSRDTNLAQDLLAAYNGPWHQNISPLFSWFLNQELNCYQNPSYSSQGR